MLPTATILRHLESLGWATSMHRMRDYVEMHAVLLSDPDQQRIARVEGDDDEAAYRCALLLAEMVGVEPEDG